MKYLVGNNPKNLKRNTELYNIEIYNTDFLNHFLYIICVK